LISLGGESGPAGPIVGALRGARAGGSRCNADRYAVTSRYAIQAHGHNDRPLSTGNGQDCAGAADLIPRQGFAPRDLLRDGVVMSNGRERSSFRARMGRPLELEPSGYTRRVGAPNSGATSCQGYSVVRRALVERDVIGVWHMTTNDWPKRSRAGTGSPSWYCCWPRLNSS